MKGVHRIVTSAGAAAAVLAGGLLAGGAVLSPAASADEPHPSEYRIDTQLVSCFFDFDSYDFVTIGKVTSRIASVREPNSRWYQRITIEIDAWDGTGWQRLERHTRDHHSFTSAHVPTQSKDAIRNHFADGLPRRVKVVVKLRKVRNNRRDKTVWTKEFAGSAAACTGPGSG